MDRGRYEMMYQVIEDKDIPIGLKINNYARQPGNDPEFGEGIGMPIKNALNNY